MTFYIKIFPTLLLLLHSVKSCTVNEHEEMQEKWRNCSNEVMEEFYNNECKLVTSVVEDCGKLWSNCYNKNEMKEMKDLHIKGMIAQYGRQGELEECQIVREYYR